MSDAERLDEFFARLQSDPDLAAIAVVLQPYRRMMGDPSAIVAVIDKVITYWQQTTPQESRA